MEGVTSTLVPVTSAMQSLTSVMASVYEIMVSNPLLVMFLGASLLGVGIRVFRKIKAAAR